MMENFKKTVEVKGLSKVMKIFMLMVGMGAAGNAFSQEKVANMEQLIKDAKQIELVLSEQVVKTGSIGNYNGVFSAEKHDDSRTATVFYSNEKRTEPITVFIGKGNFYYLDKNADGKVDAVYIDKNKIPAQIEEASMKALMSMSGEITQTELDLSSGGGIQNEFTCFNLGDNKVYDTLDKQISDIAPGDKKNMEEKLQQLFNATLKSNLENLNK